MHSLLEHMESYHQLEEDRKFRCDECGRSYRHAGSLANHKKTHDVGSFHCPVCSRQLSNALALKSHLRTHTSHKNYSCFECGKAFRLATQLATHEKVHRNREARERTKRKHELDYSIGDGCIDDQLQDFNAVPDLQSDLGLDIAPENSLSNSGMPDLVPSSTPESDMSGDVGDRPFKCDLCEKTYRHHGSLINHRKSHQMGLFECPVCFKQFSNLAALNSHQRTHNKSRDQPSTAIPESVQRDSKPEKAFPTPQNGPTNVNFCHLCQVSFPSDDEFQNHILLHNSSSVSFELADDMAEDHHFPYNHNVTQPSEANPYSPNDTQLMPPLLDKEKDFNQMERPVENGQIYIPQLIDDNPCSLDTQGMPMTLGSENASSDSQLSEMDINEVKQEGAYNSDRRFKCHICGKSYRHAGSLINHKRSHQTGIFQCSICRKNYPHLAALRSHLRIHRARPSSLTHSAEGDWLSSEPLTLENQQGCFPSQEGEDGSLLDLPHDFQDSAQLKEESNEQETTEFHNQFDMSYPQDSELHLPQGEPLMEHMCADCGETFSDIAGIKSHMCPHLHQQFQALPNGSAGHLIPQKAKQQHFLGESEEHIVFEGHNNNDTKPFIDENNLHRNMHGQLISDGEDKGHDDEGEEDDGEMYQCSVCGNHYTSMRALRSHLRGHTQIHGTPSSGPSSLSSVEVEREDKPGASLQGDDSLMICSTCGESFTKSQDLLSHQLLHSGLDIDKPENYSMHNQSSLKLKEELESIICGKCGVVCTSFQQLDTHSCTGQRQGDSMKCDEELHPGNGFGQELRHFNGSAGNRERQYTCDQCGRTYRHAGSLLNHKKSHKTGVFRCYVCQKRFYNLLALKNHQRTHFDVKKHSCTECGKAFKIHKQLLTHQRVHQENKAKIKELNEQIQSLMQMNGNSSVSGMQPFTGNKKRTARRRKQKETPNSETTCTMKEDQTGDPDNPRPYVCDQCGRSYRHAGSLVNHKNSHKTGEYYCAVCKNTYSNQLAMKNHLRIHFAVKKHCCQDCGKGFRGKKQLLSHNCSHNRKNIGAKGRGRRRTKDLTCKKCRLVFPSTNQLADHTCAKEPKLTTIPQGGEQCVGVTDVPGGETVQKEERPFKCNICGRSYRHAGSLLNHKNTHKTGHFKCTFCAKPFSNPMALRNHTRIHTQKKKFVCPTCGKAFRLSSILHNHMKIHARAVTHFSCEACGKSFQGKSGLKRHRCNRNGPSDADDSHREGGDKCYMCDQCGRSYRHAGSLLNHKKTHSADLLHCSLCLKTFSDPLELQSHSQMVRHCCPDCGKTFCEFSHMQSHMEVHSKGHPYYCNICQQSLPNMVSFQQHQVLHQNIQGQTHHPHMTNGMQMDQHTEFQGLPQLSPASRQAQVSFPDPHELQGASGDALEREEKSHVCEHCGRTYRHAGSLLNHKNSHKMGSFFCSVCQKEFTNLMALKNHRRIHTEPKRYQCLECGKAFRVSTQLICHRRIHTKEKPFSCLLCDKRFSSKSNLRHHQKMHQNTQNAFESSFNMDVNAFMGLDVDPFL